MARHWLVKEGVVHVYLAVRHNTKSGRTTYNSRVMTIHLERARWSDERNNQLEVITNDHHTIGVIETIMIYSHTTPEPETTQEK